MIYLAIANMALIVMIIYLYYFYRLTKKDFLKQVKLLRNKNIKQEHDIKNFEKKFFQNNNDFNIRIEALMVDMLKLKQEKERETALRHDFEQKYKILKQKNNDFESIHQEFNNAISGLLKDISKYK
ncbi:MAG: hypothetical protein ACKO6C_02015 [Alphaproteobacteria bacterium]